jgi:predicted HTH domain antitoxin
MQITVQITDELIQQPDPGRAVLEALAIEGYRTEVLSPLQARTLLGLSRFEFDGFLKKHQVWDHAYGVDDLTCDLMTISKR